jgi:L-seryl-tRNA(Ser) seleniumtransferase
MSELDAWGLRPVVNAAGTMTALGASRAGPEARVAVAEILTRFVLIDELLDRASAAIARATGAEAGFVTSSAAAGVTLACAAAIAGDDLALIERLPDAGGREARVAVQMGQMIHYGGPVPQAVAAAGARLVPLGTAALCEAYHLEAACRDGLAAILHVVSHHTVREGELPLELVAEIAGAQRVPLIVDMAAEYDLHGPLRLGAQAVIWSGHKFLAGPTSGLVAGPAGFIRALRLQNRGLGRLMKVGKEGIAGAIAALAAWEARDHAAERAREGAVCALWLQALGDLPGVSAALHPDWTGNPVTRVELRLDPAAAGLHAWELSRRCLAGSPAVALRDDLVERQLLYLDPTTVTAEEAALVAGRIAALLGAARAAGDGPGPSWAEVKRGRGAAGGRGDP